MRSPRYLLLFVALVFATSFLSHAQLQTPPTASRSVDLSLFGGITGVYTGLSNGKNQAVTAGLDLNLPSIDRFRPSLELRVTAPIARGKVDNQRSILAGPRVEFYAGRFHPYLDFLAGRGQINFSGPYDDFNGHFIYSQPRSTVISTGAGLRFDLTSNLSALGDVQFQRWDTPASLSGHLFAKPFTAGFVYRFTGFSRYPSR